jgi:hypothetical protein
MINIVVSLNDKKKWVEILSNVEHSFYHTWHYCNAINHLYSNSIKMAYINNDSQYLIFTYLERSTQIEDIVVTDIHNPYGISGVITNSDNWLILLDTFLSSNNYVCFYHQQSHLLPITVNSDVNPNYRETFIVSNTDRLKWSDSIHKNHKRNIKKLSDSGFNVINGKHEIKEQFVELYKSFYLNKKMSGIYDLSENALSALFELSEVRIFYVISNGKLLNSSMFFCYDGHAEFMYSASKMDYRSLSVLVLNEAICFYLDQNCSIGLGGGISENDGLSTFKQRFNAQKAYFGEVKYISNKELYDEISLPQNNYFQAYIRN